MLSNKNLRVSESDQYFKTSLAHFMILIHDRLLSMASHATNVIENKRKYHIMTLEWKQADDGKKQRTGVSF